MPPKRAADMDPAAAAAAVAARRQRDRERKAAAREARAAAASSSSSAAPPVPPPLTDDAVKILAVRAELGALLQRPLDDVPNIKFQDGLYDPIDGIMIISEKDRSNSAHELQAICERYPDMHTKLTHVNFRGQGNHSNSKGCDLPTFVEIMMCSTSRKAAPLRELAARTLCRVIGGDEHLADEILRMRHVQNAMAQHDPTNPLRAFGQYVEQQQSSAPDGGRSSSVETRRKQLELEKLELEHQALAAETEARMAQIKRKRDSDELLDAEAHALKVQESQTRKEEAEKLWALKMQELALEDMKRKEETQSFLVEKTGHCLDRKEKVEAWVASGKISRQEGDKLLGNPRRLLRVSLTKILERIWEGAANTAAANIRVSRSLPKNFAQRFSDAYTLEKARFFPDKPLGDFTNDFQAPPHNIMWYHVDLVAIWRCAEALRVEELYKVRQQGLRGLLSAPQTDSERPRAEPTLEECCQRFGFGTD